MWTAPSLKLKSSAQPPTWPPLHHASVNHMPSLIHPWVKYNFVCHCFKCNTLLVSSHIAKCKRFCKFVSSPLNLLPEDGFLAIVNFLEVSYLKRLLICCSVMYPVVKRVVKEMVERVQNHYPTGPINYKDKVRGRGNGSLWQGKIIMGCMLQWLCQHMGGPLLLHKENDYWFLLLWIPDGERSRCCGEVDKFVFDPTSSSLVM